MPDIDRIREFSPGWLGNYFTNLMKPQPGGKVSKMNSPKDHRPVKILESHLVVSEFIDQQERLLQLLRKSTSANWDVRVPISLTQLIKLKLGDVLCFTQHIKSGTICKHNVPCKPQVSSTKLGASLSTLLD